MNKIGLILESAPVLAYSNYKAGGALTLEATSSARDVFIYWHAISHQQRRASEILQALHRSMRDLVNPGSRIACITCMMLCACGISGIGEEDRDRTPSDLRYPLSALLMDTQREMERLLAHSRDMPVALDPEALSMRLVAYSMVRQGQYVIDVQRFFVTAEHLLESAVRLSEWTASAMALLVSDVFQRDLAQLEPALATNKTSGAVVQRFFEKFPNPSTPVPVRKKMTAPVRKTRTVLGLGLPPRTNKQ